MLLTDGAVALLHTPANNRGCFFWNTLFTFSSPCLFVGIGARELVVDDEASGFRSTELLGETRIHAL